MNIRLLFPLSCLAGLFGGLMIMGSPLYIPGGIVSWLEGAPPNAWLQHFFGTVMSVLLGIGVMILSGIAASLLGFAFALESTVAANSRPQNPAEIDGLPEPPTSDDSNAEELDANAH